MTNHEETNAAAGAPFERPVRPVARRLKHADGHWNVITEEGLEKQPEWVREMWSNGAEMLYSQGALDVLHAELVRAREDVKKWRSLIESDRARVVVVSSNAGVER